MTPQIRGIGIRSMTPLIQVFDMPASLRFYCEKLGFELVASAGPPGDMGWAMLRWCVPEGHAAARASVAQGGAPVVPSGDVPGDAPADAAPEKTRDEHAHCVVLMLNTQYELHQRPTAPDPARTAAHADTALYFSCPDVPAAYQHLRTQGLAVEPPYVTGYGYDQVDLQDPDGYYVCFHWPAQKAAK